MSIVDPTTLEPNTDATTIQERIAETPAPEPTPTLTPAPTPETKPSEPPAPEPKPAVKTQEALRAEYKYPEGDEATQAVYDVFAKNEVHYDTMQLLLSNVLTTGNLESFTADMQGILSPVDASVAKVLLGNIRDNAYAKNEATYTARYDAAGGKANYDNMVTWAQGDPEAAAILSTIDTQENTSIQKLLVGNLMLNFNNSGNNPAQGTTVQASTTSGGANEAPSTRLEPITARQYAEGLNKLCNDGEWNGETGSEPEAAKLLHKRAFASKLHEA
jgi:hypothetical protein